MLDHEHPQRTGRHQYRYLFTHKHHGGHGVGQWVLTEPEEFAVFDGADQMELTDDAGNLYGALRDGEESLRRLGALEEQVAKFPQAAEGMPWHGYPVWPLSEQTHRPAREVFDKMVRAGLITELMRRRLRKGSHI